MERSYLGMLVELSGAISDVRWGWVLAVERALFYLASDEGDLTARSALAGYDVDTVLDPEFLEVYLHAHSESLGSIDLIKLATRITELTTEESSRFQYKILIAIQYFLMNDSNRAEVLARAAVDEFDSGPPEGKTRYGKYIFAIGVMQLGQILDDESMLRRAIELLTAEVSIASYKDVAIADIWRLVGECYRSLEEYYMAEKLYCRALAIHPAPLTYVYLAEVQLALGRADRSKHLLDSIAIESMSAHNFFDYAIARCRLALATKNLSDKKVALEHIKVVVTKDPYFKDLIRQLLIGLYELPASGSALTLESIFRKLNKYVTLNPNVAGVGINLNTMIDDYLNRTKRN